MFYFVIMYNNTTKYKELDIVYQYSRKKYKGYMFFAIFCGKLIYRNPFGDRISKNEQQKPLHQKMLGNHLSSFYNRQIHTQ
jgi:hypothetical protein